MTKLCQGWNSLDGDRFFENQRRVADRSNTRTAKYFYIMMQKIAKQLQQSTGALLVSGSGVTPGRILDLCMAPGGFLYEALKLNPDSSAVAFSLPASSGGHTILLPADSNVVVNLLDITMLAADMGVTDIPMDHPDAENFQPLAFSSNDTFDLILCDGQVLRTHARASYWEATEARRLAASQLVLGLEHVRPGGTMIVLLHRVELWSTVSLLHRFSKFSSLMLFKPTAGHAKRSSFYMVATKIDPQHPAARLAIEQWKRIWKSATFGTQEDYETVLMKREQTVEEVLEEFGSELIIMGKKIWRIQAKALADAPFIHGPKGSGNST
jgi:23S rRNA U2552 (ribose-2'-O)-methylase RlmE/FtsJ